MCCYAKGLIYWGGEFVNLVHGRNVPQTDGLILADCYDDAFAKVEVHVQDLVGVRPEEGAVLLV